MNKKNRLTLIGATSGGVAGGVSGALAPTSDLPLGGVVLMALIVGVVVGVVVSITIHLLLPPET